MSNIFKKLTLATVISTFLIVPVVKASVANSLDIFINGKQTVYKGSTMSEQVMVPLDLLSENLGCEVEYDESTGVISIKQEKENPIVILNNREAKKGDVEVDIQYPQIQGLRNDKVEDRVNDVFKKHVEDFKLATKDFDTEVKELREVGFKHNYSAIVNYDVKYNKNGLLSVVFTNYTYTGGAHGAYGYTAYTFDLLSGEVYQLEDLFHPAVDYKTSINNIVKEEFKKMDYSIDEFESISDNQGYYLSSDGIVVFFSLYEYTPYAAGIPEFTIPYGQMKYFLRLDNLKSNYESIINNENLNNTLINTVKDTDNDKNFMFNMRYPQLSGFDNEEAQEKINSLLKEYALNFKQSEINQYKSLYDGSTYVDDTNYIITLDYAVKYNCNNILSVVFTEYAYTGGAHGRSRMESFTFNTETGDKYQLGDLFKDGVNYIDEINSRIRQKISTHLQKEFINFESINKSEQQLDYFYLGSNGSIVMYFQHYEIGPYALGMPEFALSYEEIENIVRDDIFKDIPEKKVEK